MTVLMRLKFASVALTRTAVAAPAVAVGVPARPLAVPGAKVSPGRSASKRLNGPGDTTTLPETAAVRDPLENRIVLVAAPAQARFVKVATPLAAVIFVAPSRVPTPLLIAALTTSASLLRTLLKASSIRITGCW